MVYQWNEGTRIKIDPQIAGEALDEIRSRHGGHLAPEIVVKESRPKRAPLHGHFEWDDRKAAHLHREEQARLLIRSIRIVEERGDRPGEPQRAYINVDVPSVGSRYVPAATVMSDRELRKQALKDCYAMLQGARRRLENIQNIGRVHEAFDKLQLELELEIEKPSKPAKLVKPVAHKKKKAAAATARSS
jgi:hypothetical protein